MEVKQGSILIVEDEKRIRELEASRLNGEGYTVTTAENGKQALGLIKSNSFDLALFQEVEISKGIGLIEIQGDADNIED